MWKEESIPITKEEKDWVPTIDESGASGYFYFTSDVKLMHSKATEHYKNNGDVSQKRIYEPEQHYDGQGWRHPNLAEPYIRLKRVIDRFSEVNSPKWVPMAILSAYRSDYYNKFIAKGVSNSVHKSGKAIDVKYDKLTTKEKYKFAKIASQEGFTAIGVYGTFIHLDVRAERKYWIAGYDGAPGSKYPVPEDTVEDWRFTLGLHKLDLFRNG